MDNQGSYIKYNPDEKSSEENNSFYFNKDVNGFQFATIKKKPTDLAKTLINKSIPSQPNSFEDPKKPSLSKKKKQSLKPKSPQNNSENNSLSLKQSLSHPVEKKETFGWEADNSVAVDIVGNKIGVSIANNFSNINKSRIEKKETLGGWQPEESFLVDGFGVNKGVSMTVASKSKANPSIQRKLVKPETTGWNPQESVCVNEFGDITKKNKSNTSISSPAFPVLESIQVGHTNQERNGFEVQDSIKVLNHKEKKLKNGGWDAIQSIEVDVTKTKKNENLFISKKNNEKEDLSNVNESKTNVAMKIFQQKQNSNYTLYFCLKIIF